MSINCRVDAPLYAAQLQQIFLRRIISWKHHKKIIKNIRLTHVSVIDVFHIAHHEFAPTTRKRQKCH